MFILQSREEIYSQLLQKQKIAEEKKLKDWDRKKSYLAHSMKKAEDTGDADDRRGTIGSLYGSSSS